MSTTVTYDTSLLQRGLKRQAVHWLQAARHLRDYDRLINSFGMSGLHRALSQRLQLFVTENCDAVIRKAQLVLGSLDSATEAYAVEKLKGEVIALRDMYLATETAVHYYTDAVNSRTGAHIASIMRACDILCKRSMDDILRASGKVSPLVLTFVNKGVGASILKSGLRLWNGAESPFAAVKVTYHNLFRPTAIIHETGHQVAHMLNWNDELAVVLESAKGVDAAVAKAFSLWSSEIAADVFAFVHTGYGSISALHDVVSGKPQSVFAYHRADPHPIGYVRMLLGIEWCKICYGNGPWDDLKAAFMQQYDIRMVDFDGVPFVKKCVDAIPQIAELCLNAPLRTLNGNSVVKLIPPGRVSPQALQELRQTAGDSLYTSHVWMNKEPIRTLALNSYLIATMPDAEKYYQLQENWMKQLGFAIDLN